MIVFGVNNCWSSHAESLTNNFLIFGVGDTFDINGSFGPPEKKLSINFSKANIEFVLSLHQNVHKIYVFFNGK